MSEDKYDLIIDNIISIKPMLVKKLINPSHISRDFPSGSLYMMIHLDKNQFMTMSEISKELSMPKPNVTAMIDKLIVHDFVERNPKSNDRRVIEIRLTGKGLDYINEMKENIRKIIKDKLTVLNDDEVNRFLTSLQNVKEILMKVIGTSMINN